MVIFALPEILSHSYTMGAEGPFSCAVVVLIAQVLVLLYESVQGSSIEPPRLSPGDSSGTKLKVSDEGRNVMRTHRDNGEWQVRATSDFRPSVSKRQ